MIRDILIILSLSLLLTLGSFVRGFFWSGCKTKNFLRNLVIMFVIAIIVVGVVYYFLPTYSTEN